MPFTAMAQYNGPAVESCRAFAKREAAREGAKPEDVVIVRDQALLIERYGRKLGNQPVASILTGNGAVVLEGTPTAELSFICLLADEKRPLFFNWLPRQNVSALAQCTRSESTRGKSRECLDFLLRVAEQDLTQIYAERFQEANAKGGSTLEAFRKANDEWKEYRDAECARRRELAPKGVSPEDYQLACMVELMRQRGRDMR
ncbi:MAG: lysozyme inhibitor LprI family protein [Betaproteobacteria bacterium]